MFNQIYFSCSDFERSVRIFNDSSSQPRNEISEEISEEVEEAKRSYCKYLSQVFSKHRSHSAKLDQQCESVQFFDPLCVPKNASLNNDNESVAGPALANPIYFTAAAKPRFCSRTILPGSRD